jgi:transcriptional regulator with XRE-family HTH domain
MLISDTQCRAARGMLKWGQSELASSAGLGLSTIVDFERGRRQVSEEAIVAIRTALEAAGIQFLAEGDVAAGAGVALRNG